MKKLFSISLLLIINLLSLEAADFTNTTALSYRAATNFFRQHLSASQFDTNTVPFAITNIFGVTGFSVGQFNSSGDVLSIKSGAVITNFVTATQFTASNDAAVYHLAGYGAAPSVAPNANLGTTGSVIVDTGATDTSGLVTITPGGTGIAIGSQFSVIFTGSYTNSPHPIVQAANSAAGGKGVYVTSVSSGGFTVGVGQILTSGTPYAFCYQVIQ